jgi:hypothetical protein
MSYRVVSDADILRFEIVFDFFTRDDISYICECVFIEISKKVDIFDLMVLNDIFEDNSVINREKI